MKSTLAALSFFTHVSASSSGLRSLSAGSTDVARQTQEVQTLEVLDFEQCFPMWSFKLQTKNGDDCSFETILGKMTEKINNARRCNNDPLEELKAALGVDTEAAAEEEIEKICGSAYAEQYEDSPPFKDVTRQPSLFNKEYFDGGTYYNEERQYRDEYNINGYVLEDDPAPRINQWYRRVAQSDTMEFPSDFSNFESCDLRAVMCCFVQDRQAGDNNGNCATPYDDNCVDANPADNTDVCYVDMTNSPHSNHVRAGFAVYQDGNEDDSHCHGFAWAQDETDPSGRFKGNNLFYVSMYDHFVQRGYVRNVPGAPMCGCIEQMPVVTRSDCTQIDIINEVVLVSYEQDEGMYADVASSNIEFNACEGVDENGNADNNDLESYYRQLVREEKASAEELEVIETKHLVGDGDNADDDGTACNAAIDAFISQRLRRD